MPFRYLTYDHGLADMPTKRCSRKLKQRKTAEDTGSGGATDELATVHLEHGYQVPDLPVECNKLNERHVRSELILVFRPL